MGPADALLRGGRPEDASLGATPQSASLAEMGGRLYQQATYVNGTPYAFQSNLPVLAGYPTGTYPTPGPMSLQLNVSAGSRAS